MSGKIKLIILAVFLLPALELFSQDWVIPDDQSALSNPQDYTLTNVKSGRNLYILNCKSCHGDAGKFNALPLVPPPPDVTDEQMQANSEGDLHYKITHGRGAMPQFATVLSEDERWNIVNFIMNYNPERTALYIEAPPIKALLIASIDEEKGLIEVQVEAESKNGNFTRAADVPVIFSAKKIFGNLQIGEGLTDKEGNVTYKIPDTLIGDEEGVANIVVSLNEDFEAMEAELEVLKLATPKKVTKLIRRGVLWSTNDNMPLWLVFSFLGVVAAAWLTIGYVVFQIVKIKKSAGE